MVRLGQCRGVLLLNPQFACVVEGGYVLDSFFVGIYVRVGPQLKLASYIKGSLLGD